MGAFNTVIVPWVVQKEHKLIKLVIQFKYGDCWQYEYNIGDTVKWGGNDIGEKNAKYVVVDGCLENDEIGIQEDFEVHIVNGKIDRVVPATGQYDFVSSPECYIVLEH